MTPLRESRSLVTTTVLLFLAPVLGARQDCQIEGQVELFGTGTPGSAGTPVLFMGGAPLERHPFHLRIGAALPGSFGLLLYSLREQPLALPEFGVTVYPGAPLQAELFRVDGGGSSPELLPVRLVPAGYCALEFVAQALVVDPAAAGGLAFTRAARVRFGVPAGDPAFLSPSTWPTGTEPIAVAVGDLNGDQLADLVVANSGSSDLSILLGLPDGSFADAQSHPTARQPTALAIGDLNGDLVPDLVLSSHYVGLDHLVVLLGVGDGSFVQAHEYPVGEYYDTYHSVALGDLNGDLVPDLAAANSMWLAPSAFGGTVEVWLGAGDGSFQPAHSYSSDYDNESPDSVAIADLNADQVLDLVVASRCTVAAGDGNVSVRLGAGNGSFPAEQSYPAGICPDAVSIGDLNGDQVPDLAVADSGTKAVRVLFGFGDGSFAATQSFLVGGFPNSIAIGDLDGDLVLDLAVAISDSSGVSVLTGRGDGTFEPAQTHAAGVAPRWVELSDLDGDLVPDLVLADFASDCAQVLLNHLLP